MTTAPILEVADVKKSFAGVAALSGISFTLPRNAITSIIGPNGSGKTSLLNIITGFYTADSGSVRLNGKELIGLPSHRIAAQGVGRTFQHIRLFKELTALENVLVGAERRGHKNARQRALAMLERLGLANWAGQRADSLPYGHQRRLEIARSLAAEPQLLILDEPAAGMNPSEKQELNDMLRAIQDGELSILLVEHDMDLVMDVSDHIAAINFGKVIAQGTPDQVRSHPDVIEAYLGRDHEQALAN